MGELVGHYELVKEIHFSFEGVEPRIIGRIFKDIETESQKAGYHWKLNYYCRLEQEATIYHPGKIWEDTAEQAESRLLDYVKRFEDAVQWEPSKSWA